MKMKLNKTERDELEEMLGDLLDRNINDSARKIIKFEFGLSPDGEVQIDIYHKDGDFYLEPKSTSFKQIVKKMWAEAFEFYGSEGGRQALEKMTKAIDEASKLSKSYLDYMDKKGRKIN